MVAETKTRSERRCRAKGEGCLAKEEEKGKKKKSGGRDLTRNEVALALLSMRLIEIMG